MGYGNTSTSCDYYTHVLVLCDSVADGKEWWMIHAQVGKPIPTISFDYVINVQGNLNEKKDFLEKMRNGFYKDKDVLVFNAGEAELTNEFNYYVDPLQFDSYTEVTGAYNMDRFHPIADSVYIVSYPYIWLQDQIITHGSDQSDYDLSVFRQVNSVNAPRVLFTYMMRQPKPHRRMMWDLLEKENLLNEFCTNAEKGITIDLKDNVIINYGGEKRIDNKVYYDGNSHQSHKFPPWYFDCLIDFIPETHTKQMFFTEKTWRAFLGMRVPLIIGAQNSMKELADLGFQFPPYIRWHEWDNKHHEYDRIRGAIEVLKELQNEDISELWRLSNAEREHNFHLALDLAGRYEPPFQGEGFEDYTEVYKFAKGIADYAKKNLMAWAESPSNQVRTMQNPDYIDPEK